MDDLPYTECSVSNKSWTLKKQSTISEAASISFVNETGNLMAEALGHSQWDGPSYLNPLTIRSASQAIARIK